MKTIENNKIIAEFLNVKIHPCETIEKFKFLPMEERGLYNGYFVEDLKYHEDWNKLMEVVEKIESLNYIFEIKTTWCRIKEIGTGSVIVLRWEEDRTKIEAVYNACIDFINFYNEQNKDS